VPFVNEYKKEYKKNQLSKAHSLVNDHIALVNRIAGYLKARVPKFMEYDDMVQIGMLGLLSAAESFDASNGVEFKDYAKSRIKGAILDEVRKLSDISRLAIKNSQTHNSAIHELENELGTVPKHADVAERLGISVSAYEKQRAHIDRFKTDSLESDDGDAFDDLVGSSENPLNLLEDEQLREVITRAISELSDRDRLVLSLYYVEELNLKEIGAIIGVKESRSSQILSRIAKDLRDTVASLS
jgi:RNA polymerase sigma factor for flagellar operon FliA